MAVFLDISKAFDTVNHYILMRKIYMAGVRGSLYGWIESFITLRTQMVKIGGTISSEGTLEKGVAQGSVLGPILFLLYVNDLCDLDIRGDTYTFANDTAIIFDGTDGAEMFDRAETGMTRVGDWFCKNDLKMNIPKTKFMIFESGKINGDSRN